jgi:hypothetical protein
MPSPADLIAQSVDPARGATAPVAQAVAEDLESIFPQEAPPRPAGGRLRLGRKSPDRERRLSGRERRAVSVGALVAATFIGVSAGALIARPSAPRLKLAPVGPGAPIALTSQSGPGPGPLEPPTLAPLAALPLAGANPATQTKAAAPTASADRGPKLRRASSRLAAAHRKSTRVAAATCGKHEPCGSSSITTADARLQRAYDNAERAGVARPVLAVYHDEWSRLRDRAPREPTMVAARYRLMAGELDRLAMDQDTYHAEPSQVGPWRRFRMQVASLWR